MGRVVDLSQLVAQEVAWYADATGYKTHLYHFADYDQQLYGAFSIPDKDHPTLKKLRFIVLARVRDDKVIVEEDISDHPLYERLMEQGLSRDHIVLAYTGESIH